MVLLTLFKRDHFLLSLRTFAPKSSQAQIFFKLATQKGNDILLPKRQKKLGVTDFILERTCLEKYFKSEKLGFVS